MIMPRVTNWVLTSLAISVAAVPVWGEYTYFFSDPFQTLNTSYWQKIGGATALTGGEFGLRVPSGMPTFLASVDGLSEYETSMEVRLTGSGGNFVLLLHASNNATFPGGGTFYAVELGNPQVEGDECSATLRMWKQEGGSLVELSAELVPCHDRMRIRAVARNTFPLPGGAGFQAGPAVYIDDFFVGHIPDLEYTGGRRGLTVGNTAVGNGVSLAQFGYIDGIAPNGVSQAGIAVEASPDSVTMQWAAPPDDANGTGITRYEVYTSNGEMFGSGSSPGQVDESVEPETSYVYQIYAIDRHGNYSETATVNVATPAAETINPRRTGVRPNGAYWGAMGEQIDMLSGNLNYTIPIARAVGRGKWGVSLALSYNSQQWAKDTTGSLMLGGDVGYGFGWQLQVGALVENRKGTATNSFTFTDSTGAVYKLDKFNAGKTLWWTAGDGMYIWYSSNDHRLHFPDGSFWAMNTVSGRLEKDAGTRYPTLMQDRDGNQVEITYYGGAENTSARIASIKDVRSAADGYGGSYATHTFTYENFVMPPGVAACNPSSQSSQNKRLKLVNFSVVGKSETHRLTYSGPTPLTSPLGGITCQAPLLSKVEQLSTGDVHEFKYEEGSNGELTRVILPRGGELSWHHREFTYSTGKALREVDYRYLVKSIGALQVQYTVTRPDAVDAAKVVHSQATLVDPDGTQRVWMFQTALTPAWKNGLLSKELTKTGSSTKKQIDYTWAQDPDLRPYISNVKTWLYSSTAANNLKAISQKQQAVDKYGNQTSLTITDLVNNRTRTYRHTYVTGTAYQNRYIYNLLQSTVVNDGSDVTLVTNQYDITESDAECGTYAGSDYPTGLRQYDYAPLSDPNYKAGHLNKSTRNSTVVTCYGYDITGMAKKSTDGTTAWSATPGTNNAVVDKITVGSLTTDLDWTDFLALKEAVGPNNDTTTATYDGQGRPYKTTSAFGAETVYTYGSGSDYWEKATVGNRFTKTSFDGLGRPVKVESGHGTIDPVVVSVVDTEYGPCACSAIGKVKKVSRPHASGTQPGPNDWTTYVYDALGRTLEVGLPGNSGKTEYTYDENTVRVEDPADRWKEYSMDAFGNVTKVEEPNPNGGSSLTTTYTYTIRDQLNSVTMTRGGVTQNRTWQYNRTTGRLTCESYPEIKPAYILYEYNTDGTVSRKYKRTSATVCNAAGAIVDGTEITFTYDSYKRVLTKNWTEGQVARQYNYTYDVNPDATGQPEPTAPWKGRLSKVTYQTGGGSDPHTGFTEVYWYFATGAVQKKELRVSRGGNTNSWNVTYTYDNEGKVVNTDGLTYGYDNMGRPATLTSGSNEIVKDVVYGVAGELKQMKVAQEPSNPSNWYTETRDYNERLQLTLLTVTQPGGGAIVDERYDYPAGNNGQIEKKRDLVPGGKDVTYVYDALKRLKQAYTADSTWGLEFTYDGFGNRLTQSQMQDKGGTEHEAIVNAATNRMTASGGLAVTYDASGNITAMPGPGGCTMTMTYDGLDRLSTVWCYGEKEAYAYGPDGRRVYKKSMTSGTWTEAPDWIYFYGVEGNLLGTYRLFAGGETRYTYFGRKRVRRGNSGDTAVFEDRLGSVVWQGPNAKKGYYPYGEEQGTNPTLERHTFGTYFRDEVTNLDYAQQRYYSSTVGRFLSADPYEAPSAVREPQGWNRYAYVMGDPANYGDPDGLNRCHSDSGGCVIANIYFTFYMMQKVGTGVSSKPSQQEIEARQEWEESALDYGKNLASSLKKSVAEGLLNDCEAMGEFIGTLVNDGYSSRLAIAFGAVTPDAPLVPAGIRRSPGAWYFGNMPNRSYMGPSGYAQGYREEDWDQGHHFALYFQIGLQLGMTYRDNPLGAATTAILDSAVGEALQLVFGGSGNMADYRLGRDAALFGAMTAAGAIPTANLKRDFLSNFCDSARRKMP